jgi:hypothetical protein
MNYSTQDTSWTISAKGNHWRRLDGKVLVVGEYKDSDNYWAMRDGEFLKDKFETLQLAKQAAEKVYRSTPYGEV